MVLKDIDDKTKDIKLLEGFLKENRSPAQKKLIETDLKKIKAGYEAEKENAYYLDFELKDSKNLYVLHDIRIEHNGRTAQFDHIIISRLWIELLESKSSKGTLTINNDGTVSIKGKGYSNNFPSPAEQVNRHSLVIEEFIKDKKITPKRVELLGGIPISTKVLINPKTIVTNKNLPSGYVRADSFISKRAKEIDKLNIVKAAGFVSKMLPLDKVLEICQLLIDSHAPIGFDYEKKYKVKSNKDKKLKFDGKGTVIDTVDSDEKYKPKEKVTVCPRCKTGTLIEKKTMNKKAISKYGDKGFRGCDQYPRCRYIEKPQ